jgi:hypothetical protein
MYIYEGMPAIDKNKNEMVVIYYPIVMAIKKYSPVNSSMVALLKRFKITS